MQQLWDSDPSFPVDGPLKETYPIRIEMFHLSIKVITQNNFLSICIDLSH